MEKIFVKCSIIHLPGKRFWLSLLWALWRTKKKKWSLISKSAGFWFTHDWFRLKWYLIFKSWGFNFVCNVSCMQKVCPTPANVCLIHFFSSSPNRHFFSFFFNCVRVCHKSFAISIWSNDQKCMYTVWVWQNRHSLSALTTNIALKNVDQVLG